MATLLDVRQARPHWRARDSLANRRRSRDVLHGRDFGVAATVCILVAQGHLKTSPARVVVQHADRLLHNPCARLGGCHLLSLGAEVQHLRSCRSLAPMPALHWWRFRPLQLASSGFRAEPARPLAEPPQPVRSAPLCSFCRARTCSLLLATFLLSSSAIRFLCSLAGYLALAHKLVLQLSQLRLLAITPRSRRKTAKARVHTDALAAPSSVCCW